jgi:hypothetical protein
MAHKCGFIAAESLASAEWHKKIISSFESEGKKFRAWSRGEHPTLFQIRIFLPNKYNIIPTIDSTQILKTYNPFLKIGTFELLREEDVKDGRALFFSISRDAFLKLRETYKLNFPQGKVECNNATPKNSNIVPPHPTIPIPTSLQIPPTPEINQQLNQAIQALTSTPLPSIPQNKTNTIATIPSPSPEKPIYSPLSSRATSSGSESDANSARTISKREAQLETSGASYSSKGSHQSRERKKKSHSKRKRITKHNTSDSSSHGPDKKKI